MRQNTLQLVVDVDYHSATLQLIKELGVASAPALHGHLVEESWYRAFMPGPIVSQDTVEDAESDLRHRRQGSDPRGQHTGRPKMT